MKTDAQIKAQKKYMNKIRHTTKAQLSCVMDRTDFEQISDYCEKSKISKARFVVLACKAWIEMHPLDKSD